MKYTQRWAIPVGFKFVLLQSHLVHWLCQLAGVWMLRHWHLFLDWHIWSFFLLFFYYCLFLCFCKLYCFLFCFPMICWFYSFQIFLTTQFFFFRFICQNPCTCNSKKKKKKNPETKQNETWCVSFLFPNYWHPSELFFYQGYMVRGGPHKFLDVQNLVASQQTFFFFYINTDCNVSLVMTQKNILFLFAKLVWDGKVFGKGDSFLDSAETLSWRDFHAVTYHDYRQGKSFQQCFQSLSDCFRNLSWSWFSTSQVVQGISFWQSLWPTCNHYYQTNKKRRQSVLSDQRWPTNYRKGDKRQF